jgi:hypothetical protein
MLLAGNAAYCIVHIIAAFRSPRPASGVWGLLALAGVGSALAIAAAVAGAALSGI